MTRVQLLAAVVTGTAVLVLYRATLLPGFDFGDTGFFQTMVGSATLTPRDAYPLYFGIGNLFVWLSGSEPAHALNLASAVEGAVACGVIVLVGAELSGSLAAGVAASLLFAASYTFWSQSIIAEVYALHMTFVALTLLLVLEWARQPTMGRLALFLAVYALGFGNHLSMILLFPGYLFFALFAQPGRWREMLRPHIVALAVCVAAAGSLQYTWNLRGLWQAPIPPRGLIDAMQTFWFDVTKGDWRETMVMNVPRSILANRLAMYAFDVRQQFGWVAVFAPIGLARLFACDSRRALLMILLYAVNAAFAYTYNVGDTHVFYLPSHLMLALLVAPGIVLGANAVARMASLRRHRAAILAVASGIVALVAAGRMYRDFPALDRSADDRPARVLAEMTAGLDDGHAILLADLNWQLVNGLAYFSKVVRRDLVYAWMPQVLLYAPALIRDNLAIGRDVALTARARDELQRAYGPLLPTVVDDRVHPRPMSAVARDVPRGTRYVLCVLRPTHEFGVDLADLNQAVRTLTGGSLPMPDGAYTALAGLAGSAPVLTAASATPFRQTARIGDVPVEVRMESWLAFDTIRRMGFGQVVAARRHTLIVERGISFATFDEDGRPLSTEYAGNIFAPEARYLVSRGS
jgi:hypothetical protein